MDDIVIGAENEDDMAEKLILLFKRLAEFNLKIQLSKVKFFQKSIKILGIIFSRNGKQIDPSKIESITNFPPITSLKKCQQFLGMVNYLSSFIPHYAS